MKKYDYKKIRQEVKRLVKKAGGSPKNKFTFDVWDYHILPVVRHSLALGRTLPASSGGSLPVDLEALELAAYLHDYAGLLDYKLYKSHHVDGAKMAGDILKKLNYPQEKINHVKECVRRHRGSVKMSKNSIEAKILASADAMSHFTELPSMFYLTFGIHKFRTRPGAKWLKSKLQRSWAKIIPEGKKLVRTDYEAAMRIINSALK